MICGGRFAPFVLVYTRFEHRTTAKLLQSLDPPPVASSPWDRPNPVSQPRCDVDSQWAWYKISVRSTGADYECDQMDCHQSHFLLAGFSPHDTCCCKGQFLPGDTPRCFVTPAICCAIARNSPRLSFKVAKPCAISSSMLILNLQ